MQLTEKQDGEFLILALEGELDASSSITLDTSLRAAMDAKHKHILIDCAELSYISSPGLGVFMSYLRELEERSVCMVLFNLKENVQSTFRILGLDELISIEDDLSSAKNKCHI